jgi:hypothetical protein
MPRLPALPAGLAIVALALAGLAGAAPAAAQEDRLLRAEFWTDLNGIPASGDPWPLPLPVAAGRLVDEAAFVFSGQLWGFDFDWTPSDKARNVAEYFAIVPAGGIPHGDPRLLPEDTRVEGQSLLAYVSYRPTATEAGLLASYALSPWKSAQGQGSGSYLKGYAGRREAYGEAARAALRDLLRGLEPNKPRRVKGVIVFSGTPRIAVVDGDYRVYARFRIKVTEVQSWERF